MPTVKRIWTAAGSNLEERIYPDGTFVRKLGLRANNPIEEKTLIRSIAIEKTPGEPDTYTFFSNLFYAITTGRENAVKLLKQLKLLKQALDAAKEKKSNCVEPADADLYRKMINNYPFTGTVKRMPDSYAK